MTRFFCIALTIVFFLISCAEDILSPTVEIVQPGNGETVSGTVEIVAEADDDLGVEKVEIYIDDTLRSEIIIEPFSYTWNTLVLPDNSSHRLQARAYDAADNEGISPIVTVVVNNSIPPLYVPKDGVKSKHFTYFLTRY